MRDFYGLKEVMIPENQDLKEGEDKEAKNNIFMTKDFYRPDAKQKEKNS